MNSASVIISGISALISLAALWLAWRSYTIAEAAHETAEEANSLARKTHDDDVALRAPQLKITEYVLELDRMRVQVRNAGLSPARDVTVRLTNDTSHGNVGRDFDPYPRDIIEAGGEDMFTIPGEWDVLMERTRMGTEFTLQWRDNTGEKYEEKSRQQINPSEEVATAWAEQRGASPSGTSS